METVNLMINSEFILPPFAFNPLKHHLGFIRQVIEAAKNGADESEVFRCINSIPPQITDIYLGSLGVDELLQLIKSRLIILSAFAENDYRNWVDNSGKRYNMIELPDESRWVFRWGEKDGRYIHFHPARLSHSVRVRGTTLRTAIAMKVVAGSNTALYQDADFINKLRKNRLQLSPVKNIGNTTALIKVMEFI